MLIEASPPIRRTVAEIDLDAVVSNALLLRAVVGERTSVLAVVKADAYGHGAVPVAQALERRAGVAGLAVMLVEEGSELRDAGIRAPILVMGGVYASAHQEMLARQLTPVVSEAADAEAFALAGRRLGRPATIHIEVDTGMRRLGVSTAALPALLEACARWPDLRIAGVCTHFASADAEDPTPTLEQMARFEAARAILDRAGIRPMLHAANSAATLRFADAHYDAVRPGLALYGGGSRTQAAGLAPAMRLVSQVVQLREAAPGEGVSYGALWRASRRSRIATVPVGYADGYPRRLTGDADVLMRGRRCPVVGAVCMDMILVDVTALGSSVLVGEDVVLLGEQGGERITATELARRAGLIEYEITCGISRRVPRVYPEKARALVRDSASVRAAF